MLCKLPRVGARMMQNTCSKCCPLYAQYSPFLEADDFMSKRGWRHVWWEVIPENRSSCPIDEEIARLLIYVLCHDDVMDRGARYFAANLREKRPNSLRFCRWPAGIYSYIEMSTFLVILMSHVFPVVGFRFEKNRGEVSKGETRLHTCLLIKFNSAWEGRKAKWPQLQGPVHRGCLATSHLDFSQQGITPFSPNLPWIYLNSQESFAP